MGLPSDRQGDTLQAECSNPFQTPQYLHISRAYSQGDQPNCMCSLVSSTLIACLACSQYRVKPHPLHSLAFSPETPHQASSSPGQ